MIWHLHTPVTGGSAVEAALSVLPGWHHIGPRGYYWLHGKDFPSLPALPQAGAIIISAETPLLDLQGIPHVRAILNETCFFGVVREPEEWLRSAVVHMARTTSWGTRTNLSLAAVKHGMRKFLRTRKGYLDRDNLQSTMAGLLPEQAARPCEWRYHYKQLVLCPVGSIPALLLEVARSVSEEAANRSLARFAEHTNSCAGRKEGRSGIMEKASRSQETSEGRARCRELGHVASSVLDAWRDRETRYAADRALWREVNATGAHVWRPGPQCDSPMLTVLQSRSYQNEAAFSHTVGT